LPVEVTTFTDWGTGYCANVVVTNNTAEALDWQAAFTVEDGDAIYDFWNVIWSQSGTQVAIEGVGWNNILQPDESTHSLGFCATRSDGNNGSGTCEVTYDVRNQWNWGFTADITLKNTGPTPINGWTLAWAFPNGQVIYEAWGSSIIGAGPNASIQNASWNANLAPGQTVGNIGFNAHHFGVNGEPVSFTLNGQSCTVK
jgi:cellulase/cellobiase CelA1